MASFPDDEDGAVLASLAEQGVDLTQPLLIEFAVETAGEASANAIANALTKAGYPAEIAYDEGEPVRRRRHRSGRRGVWPRLDGLRQHQNDTRASRDRADSSRTQSPCRPVGR